MPEALVLPALMMRSFYEGFTEEVGLEFESCRMSWDSLGRDVMGDVPKQKFVHSL